MAHFVETRKFQRISNQLIHAPIGMTVHVGLWGGMLAGGKVLTVDADDSGTLQVKAAKKHGDILMFDLKGLVVGETVLNATAGDGAVWDSCAVHVHLPRRKQLPEWTALYNNYAGDEETSEDFRARIGGQVDNDQLTNTCTLRMSEAFNGARQPIPRNHSGLLTVTGDDKLFYAIRVAEFKKYMLSTYGAPDVVRTPPPKQKTGVPRTGFAHLRGVMCFEVHFSDATGHFTLWDGTQPVHGDYFDRAYRVSLWLAG